MKQNNQFYLRSPNASNHLYLYSETLVSDGCYSKNNIIRWQSCVWLKTLRKKHYLSQKKKKNVNEK